MSKKDFTAIGIEYVEKQLKNNDGFDGFDLMKAVHYGIKIALNEQEGTPTAPMPVETPAQETTGDIVSIVEHDGDKFVRVHVGKYDFCIDLHDAPNQMSWDDAKKYAEDKGMRLFTLEEGLLMFCFKDEINAKLKEAGGDELREDDYYWSSTEYSRNYARYVYFYSGNASYTNKYSGIVVRPVAAFTCVS